MEEGFKRLALATLLARPTGGAKARAWAREVLAGNAPPPPPGKESPLLPQLVAMGWRFLVAGEPEFPPRLLACSDPPIALFVRGHLPPGPTAALVGSRRASAYGREVAFYLGKELAAAGVCVVSGMARGVDAAAHRGALAAGGPTVAVWGCGPDRVYPPEHRELAEAIAHQGALLTEYPPGVPPLPRNFPERNRLIAALAEVTVVVEADERSGALLTARTALEEGREVMAVPGSVFSPLSVGPNGLLRAGAAPVLTAQDVLDALGVARPGVNPPPHRDKETGLLQLFPTGRSVSIDELAAAAQKPLPAILEELLELELSGKVQREPDGRYRRNL